MLISNCSQVTIGNKNTVESKKWLSTSVDNHFSILALCQLQWVDEKLTSREDELRSLFLYVQSNQNPFFKVFKVPETKGISLNDFDEIIGSFQFGI